MSAERGKNRGVWRLPFDTTLGTPSGAASPLTFGTGEQAGVALSRDGTKLALASPYRSVNLEAVPFDADGAGVRGAPLPLTRGSRRVNFFGPSPDARSVVFVDERGAASHLWRVDQGGPEPFQLTLDPEFQDTFPRWSPDGRTIAFSRRPRSAASPGVANPDAGPADGGDLWLISADGASPRPAGVSPGARAVWVDADTLIAYQPSPPGYARLELGSRTVTPVLVNKAAMPIFDVSQDGRWLVGQSTEHDSVDILAVPLDGSQQARYVVTAPTADYHPFLSPSARWLYYHAEHKNLFRVPGPAQDSAERTARAGHEVPRARQLRRGAANLPRRPDAVLRARRDHGGHAAAAAGVGSGGDSPLSGRVAKSGNGKTNRGQTAWTGIGGFERPPEPPARKYV